MYRPTLVRIFRMLLASAALASPLQQAAQAQLTVLDPSNLIQNALNATRALEQIRKGAQTQAAATAESWLRMESTSVSSRTHSANVPVTDRTGEPGKYSSPSG